jgi:hypothetical protein
MYNFSQTNPPISSGPALPSVLLRSSGKDVIANGTVITFANDNLEISIAHLKFIFNFKNDQAEQRVSYKNEGPTTLVLDAYNFNNSIGSGYATPVKLGSLMERELWLSFMVYALTDSSSKTVHYSFMLGDSVSE